MLKNKFKILLLILCFCCSGCREKLIHGLTENEANKLMAQLYAVDAEPRKVQQPDGSWAIAVPSGQASWVLKYLDDTRVMKDTAQKEAQSTSIISSRDEQRFKFERSLSREIEYTLTSIENVLQARVHLNLPPRDPFFGKKLQAAESGSASILLIVTKDFKLLPADISHLVAGAAGIAKEKVTVLLDRSEVQLSRSQESVAPLKEEGFFSFSKILRFCSGVGMQLFFSLLILLGGGFWFFMKLRHKKQKSFSAIAQALQKQTTSQSNIG
ncbi:MAG: hypothetical protein ACOX2O_00090 [Bdellovibrionota bacterium]|jgi:type III secretion protein J